MRFKEYILQAGLKTFGKSENVTDSGVAASELDCGTWNNLAPSSAQDRVGSTVATRPGYATVAPVEALPVGFRLFLSDYRIRYRTVRQ